MSAVISSPQQLGGMLVDEQGRISVNGSRSWVGKDGRSYINVNGKAQPIQANALLQKDEWISYDKAVREITTTRLNGIADLRSMGLIYNAGDLGSTVAEWDESSDMTEAEINMAGVTKTENDTVAYNTNGVPIPVVRKDFQVNIRRLLASRRMGAGADVTGAQIAARLVAEKSESMLFNGSGITIGGYTTYGYTNHPQRNTGSLTYDWAAAATTGKQILEDVLAMVASLETDRHYGPFNLYVPSNFWPKLRNDYSDNKGDNTIIERIRALDVINDVKVSDVISADNVVMVQMTSDVVDLAVAQDVTTVQWDRGDGMQTNFAVMAAWAPRIKQDFDNHLGIAHYTYTSA